jgi:O-methyltransferase
MPPNRTDCHIRALVSATPLPLEDNPDEFQLTHPDTGLAYRINASSAWIWRNLDGGVEAGILARRLSSEFGVAPDEAVEALRQFVDRMAALGFVAAGDGSRETVLRRRYLDLMKSALVNLIYPEHELRLDLLEREGPQPDLSRRLRDIRYTDPETFEALVAHKRDGRNWRGRATRYSHTMVGLRRLENIEYCAARVFADGVAGDFLEAGVCQGGAAIFMRALQVAHGEERRLTWLADSFEGLPAPTLEQDRGLDLHEAVQPWLAASLAAVQDNFRTYELLSNEVRFLPGWFADTLFDAPVGPLAILRIDADLYLSTRQALEALYDKVEPGGFVIVDDYHIFPPCRAAVDEFRAERGIADPIVRIDWTAVFWRKG